MAEIHLARLAGEGGFEKIVVVKRLLPELVVSPAFVAMFLDEGKLVARLDHPNICEVHELGREGAEYYLAMPYLDGIAVHELIARPRDPDRLAQLRVAAAVIVQACAGLHHAHELRDADGAPAGLVHRDVSPSNLFVTAAGVVKVLDFGIAKVRGAVETEAGTIKGKSQYMAPEQLLGDALDRRCDVFALGIVLFELATHQRLFKRSSEYLAARAILEEPTPRAEAVDPAVPAALADVIAHDRAARFADTRTLGDAITAAMAPHGGLATAAEIAAAVTSTDELSAMRTRQARVLGEARARDGSDVATSAAPTRMLRAPHEAGARAQEVGEASAAGAPRRSIDAGKLIAVVIAIVLLVAGAWFVTTVIGALRGHSPEPRVAVAPAVATAPRVVAEPMRADASVEVPEAEIEMPADPARPPRARGQLSIDSRPYATIVVDGVSLGVTPIVKRSLAAGRHKLRATTQDGRTRELAVDIPAGKLAAPIQLTW
jgi:serine/threonine-protein kinase